MSATTDPSPRPTKKSKQAITSTGSSTGSSHTVAPHLHDAPFQPLPTSRSFYAKDTVSSCPCFLHTGARILVVGDGDLSYSVGLVKHLIGEEHDAAQRDESLVFNNCLSEQQTMEYRTRAKQSLDVAASTPPSIFSPSLLQMTCTTYESIEALSARYTEAASNADWLRSQGVRVLHGVDARLIHSRHDLIPLATARVLNVPQDQLTRLSDASYLPTTESSINIPCKFHHIIFHFPHVGGKSRIHLNRALLADFFQSATQCIVQKGEPVLPRAPVQSTSSSSSSSPSSSPNPETEIAGGCIQVSLIRGQGGSPCDTHHRPNYGDHWQILENGTNANLTLIHAFPFTDGLYAGYNNRGFRSRDEEFFWRGVAITHVLTAAETAGSLMSNDVESELNRLLQSVEGEADAGAMEVRAKMRRQLNEVPHHPLQQISTAMSDAFVNNTCINGELTQQLRAIGWRRVPVSVVTPVNINGCPSTEMTTWIRSFMGAAAMGPESFSTAVISHIVDAGRTIDSLQWNLEPLLSVAADMEKQIVQPIAIQLSNTNGSSSSSSSSPSVSQSEAPVVPFMTGGVNVLHHQLHVQLFQRDSDENWSSQNPPPELDAAAEKDCIESARLLLLHLFPETDSFAVRVQLQSSSSSSATAASTTTTSAPFNFEAQVLYQQVWHAVGKGRIVKSHFGTVWAWEWSLDKLCMIRFRIHDVRMLWSEDQRFLSQFVTTDNATTEAPAPRSWKAFIPFSIHPLCYVRDNSFWMNATTATTEANSSASSNAAEFPHARAKELTALYSSLVSLVFGSGICCQLRMTDSFMHPTRGPAIRFRCLYQSVDRALSPQRVLFLQQVLHRLFVKQAGVEMR